MIATTSHLCDGSCRIACCASPEGLVAPASSSGGSRPDDILRPMKFVSGFVWIDPTHYVPLARTAEQHGWDGVVLSDHLVHLEKIETPYPYAEDGQRPWQAADPYPDVWVSIGAMAAVTERLRFYQGVYVLPLREGAGG